MNSYEFGVYLAVAQAGLVKTADSHLDRGEALAATGLATAGLGLGAGGLFRGGHALERALTPVDSHLGHGLAEPLRGAMNASKDLSLGTVPTFAGSHYNPSARAVNVSHSSAPSVLAHELGHATGKNIPWGLYAASKGLGGIGAIGAMIGQAFTDSGSTADNAITYAPAAISLPFLAEEARASMRGLRGLHRVGGKGMALRGLLSLLPAFGTYALSAGAPIISGKIMHTLRGE